jgi:hypothetical protein
LLSLPVLTAKYRPPLARLATLSHWSGLINPVSLTSAYCVGNVDGNTHHPTHLRPQQVADKIGEAEMDQSSAGGDFNDIDRDIRREMSGDARKLADAFSEFRETWLEPPNS